MAKILVIEDHESLRNDILEMLRFEGFEVIGAKNGNDGVNLAKEHHPDLIICDIMMPEMDGYGVLDELKHDKQTLTIPFIFLTAKSDRTDVRHGMGLGADDYLTKPFVTSELLSTVEARLKRTETLAVIAGTKIKELSDNIITALPHELRTPLNTVLGFSDMLVSEAHHLSPEQVTEWATHINLAAQRLYRLVENYLMYVRVEVISKNNAELQALQARKVDHPNTIVQFHASYKAEQNKREADLHLDIAQNASVHISDHDLGKIIDELIDNAIKFSQPGTPITITCAIEGQHFIIRIADQGRGMTQHQIRSIDPFVQFERWFYEQQGSGLGLAIVQRLIGLYRGSITLESRVNEGTIVTVKLLLAD